MHPQIQIPNACPERFSHLTIYFYLFQFDRVCKLFCEDPATSQSDEFFGVFDFFLTSFSEAKQENQNIRRKREEEEKIAKQHQEVNFKVWSEKFRKIPKNSEKFLKIS